MLNHERVTDGGHHGEDLLAGRVPPHQVEQSVGLVFGVQLADTLLSDQLHGDPAVILRAEGNKNRLETVQDQTMKMYTTMAKYVRGVSRCYIK